MSAKTRPCEICSEPIEAERLEFLPDTRLCSEHAKQIAKHGGEFIVTFQQSRLNKPGSMKRNPGDVAVASKVRNHKALAKLRDECEQSGA